MESNWIRYERNRMKDTKTKARRGKWGKQGRRRCRWRI